MTGRVLILGASGRFGRHAAEAFWNTGWRVVLHDRERGDLMREAMGVDVIVNGLNPKYTDWARDVPRLTEAVIAAAQASGATVILPGNVYVYGVDAPGVLSETTPQTAENPLGRIRREMEAAYREAGVRTIVLRAGDFLDTEASGIWFDSVITAKLKRGVFVAPGDTDAAHAWAWLPDMARAAVMLADKREMLATFEDVPFPGFTLTLNDLARMSGTVAGRDLEVRNFPWWILWLARPFWPMARHLLEMRYLWSKPHRLDGARFAELLPGFRATDPLTAVATALGSGHGRSGATPRISGGRIAAE
jgi:nucleoside-diphosphate-sugar epimerase